MATIIRHTKQQVTTYHNAIKNIVLKPLQKIIIEKLAKAQENYHSYQFALNQSFTDFDHLKDLDSNVSNAVNTQITDLSEWQKNKMQTQFKQLFGIDVLPILNKKTVKGALDPIISYNISLIKSIHTDLHEQVNDQFNSIVYKKGFDQKAVFDMLTSRFSVADSRAKLIARDQTSKTIGALAQVRQTQANVLKFVWRTSEDERVRPDHQALDGKVFLWSAPPAIGIPGQPINCRCVALPYIDGLSS